MKRLRSLRFWLSALALAVGLTTYGSTAWGQADCMDNCLEALDRCRNGESSRLGLSVQQAAYFTLGCEDEYEACLERCVD
jgi:hypothetical protein